MSWLQKVKTEKKKLPYALLIYGVHGIGKSTLPSESEKPIYICSDETDELNVPKFPKVNRWSDLTEQLAEILNSKHEYKTLVIDTVDGLEAVAQKEILAGKGSGVNMATALGGYGKAYEEMYKLFLSVREKYLVPIRDKGMNVVLIGHETRTKIEDPITHYTYDNYTTSLHKKIKPIFQDWVSAILFATYKLLPAQGEDGTFHLEGDGGRVLFTEERPSHIAKNRFDLPYEIPFNRTGTWKTLAGYIDKFYAAPNSKTAEIKNAIKGIFDSMPEVSKKGIKQACQKAGENAQELTAIFDKMVRIKESQNA